MEIRKPNYYDAFRCLAGACPDSCCKDWAVQVDDISADRYRNLPGDLGEALRQVMREEDGDTILTLTPDGRCPMWRNDGLCRIQAQLGEDALCNTCSQFPRLRHDYGNFAELGLELSCPEAARLILSGDPAWVTEPHPGHEEPEYEAEIMEILLRSREEFLTYLHSGKHSVGQTLAVLLLYGYAVQEELDGGEPACLVPESNLATAERLATVGDIAGLLDFYQDLEVLTPAWQQRLRNPEPASWTEDYCAIIRYFINRYWLQAVSDYDLVGRVKLIIASCLVIKALGGNLLSTAQLYSKEIENDADNIDSILDGAYTSPALADIGLLGLLLED
jgi:lysine-N-methylase